MQYSECLPKIQRTCATLYSVVSFAADTDSGQCFPGCHCPAGKLLHAGECVQPKDCPCQYQKQFYSAGQVVKIDCNYWFVAYITFVCFALRLRVLRLFFTLESFFRSWLSKVYFRQSLS